MPLSSQRRIENECSWRAAEHLGIVESAFAQSAESRNRLLLAGTRPNQFRPRPLSRFSLLC